MPTDLLAVARKLFHLGNFNPLNEANNIDLALLNILDKYESEFKKRKFVKNWILEIAKKMTEQCKKNADTNKTNAADEMGLLLEETYSQIDLDKSISKDDLRHRLEIYFIEEANFIEEAKYSESDSTCHKIIIMSSWEEIVKFAAQFDERLMKKIEFVQFKDIPISRLSGEQDRYSLSPISSKLEKELKEFKAITEIEEKIKDCFFDAAKELTEQLRSEKAFGSTPNQLFTVEFDKQSYTAEYIKEDLGLEKNGNRITNFTAIDSYKRDIKIYTQTARGAGFFTLQGHWDDIFKILTKPSRPWIKAVTYERYRNKAEDLK
ncbi:MAG: hypothetical protein K0S74_1046 [Chlamydiales bacterium]|jgi:hypothetical protein|nr:hypothetical protein [Chlamydiales bacterium]